jgi:hypothetical protein
MTDHTDLDSLQFFVTIVVVWLVLWMIPAFVAAIVAPAGRGLVFFLLTFFLLGPLGVGFAAVATERPKPSPGMYAMRCIRCNASQNLDLEEKKFDCWRCGEGHDWV